MKVAKEYAGLFRRRVQPLLDTHGTSTRSLQHLLIEAYIQGIKDTVDVSIDRNRDRESDTMSAYDKLSQLPVERYAFTIARGRLSYKQVLFGVEIYRVDRYGFAMPLRGPEFSVEGESLEDCVDAAMEWAAKDQESYQKRLNGE